MTAPSLTALLPSVCNPTELLSILRVCPMVPMPVPWLRCSLCRQRASSQRVTPGVPILPESAQASLPPGSLIPGLTCPFSPPPN